jgi:hypothetical protein
MSGCTASRPICITITAPARGYRHSADAAENRAVEEARSDRTHRFMLDQILDAYETFARAAATGALKVIIAS